MRYGAGLLKGVCQMTEKTGFYLMSEEKIIEEMNHYPRMEVIPSVSADFCLRDGKPVCIHGTTYFVTDVYQKCFLHFNLAQCREDLTLLQKDGFCVLRSGNWMLNVEFYGKMVPFARKQDGLSRPIFTARCSMGLQCSLPWELSR